MNVREFFFDLPPELVAQDPPAVRGASRLLHLDRRTGLRSHSTIDRLADFLDPGDVLVLNNTRVFPARLLGRREPSGAPSAAAALGTPSGGAVECLLVSRVSDDDASEVWQALMHPGQKLAPG